MEAAPSATITQHGVGTPHYVKPLVADLGMSWVICQCRFYLSSPWWGPFQPGGGYKIELFLRFNLKFAQQERGRPGSKVQSRAMGWVGVGEGHESRE